MTKEQVFQFHSMALEGTDKAKRHVTIKREGGLFLVTISRAGQSRVETYPNRAQAYERAHRMGAL